MIHLQIIPGIAQKKSIRLRRRHNSAPMFFLRLRRRQNSGPNFFLRLARRQNTYVWRIQRRRKKGLLLLFFTFGEFNAATITAPAAPECCGPETPCCGKPHILPHMAFGECCSKWQFRTKCCASATANWCPDVYVVSCTRYSTNLCRVGCWSLLEGSRMLLSAG